MADLKRELKIRSLKVTGNKNVLAERLQLDHYDDERSKIENDTPNTNSEQSSGILKMPMEILEYIFDDLDLADLVAVSKTCKWMYQVASRCYQQSYSGLRSYFDKIEGCGNIAIRRFDGRGCIDIEPFIPLLNNVVVLPKMNLKMNLQEEVLYKFIDQQLKFHQLKNLGIHFMNFTDYKIADMEEVLSKLEYLEMTCCKTSDEFLEHFYSLIPNIKRLYLHKSANRCPAHSFPMLEHFEIVCYRNDVVPVTTFLALNPNIQKFGTNLANLWENIHSMKDAKIQLEDLAISFASGDFIGHPELRSFWKLLDECHKLGIYKRIHILFYHFGYEQKFFDGIASLTALKRLRFAIDTYGHNCVTLSALVHLEDLTLPDSRYITDIKIVATKFEYLKHIYFGQSNLSQVKLFISRNSKLERIQIDKFVDKAGKNEYKKVLNLIDLNRERSMLSNAKKITLFVEEPVYLATKRANRQIDLDFIKLKRTDTFNEREYDFGHPVYYR